MEEVGFRFTCRVTDELADDGSIIGQVLEQVFFATDTQLAWAKRFIAHHVLLIAIAAYFMRVARVSLPFPYCVSFV